MLGTLGEAFGTTLGTIHSGITHIAITLDITHMRHTDHIRMRLIIHITHILLITTILLLLHIMVQVMVQATMVLKMLIAEIIIVMVTQEATKHVLLQTQIQETQMAMFLAL